MADIDKGLPNTRTKIEIPSDEELQEVAVQDEDVEELKGPVEVIPEEDGGATIDYDPGAINTPGSESHFDNLADILPDDVLDPIGGTLKTNYMDYKSSRKEWERTYTEGLDLLGFKYENRNEPFQGSSGATHPVLAEAVTQFQATAFKELLPSDGPVRTQILGVQSPDKEAQAQRVKDFMNYQIMEVMEEYDADTDQMLFYLPLTGSTFKKVYFDTTKQRAVSKFVPAEDLVVPYSASDLMTAERVTHVVKMTYNDIRKLQVAGFYRDVELQVFDEQTGLQEKENDISGVVVVNQTGMKDYIPENILVYIATHKNFRGKGIGKGLMQKTIDVAEGNIALHVEPENPARFLYEKVGFSSKYIEMRYKK